MDWSELHASSHGLKIWYSDYNFFLGGGGAEMIPYIIKSDCVSIILLICAISTNLILNIEIFIIFVF
jgi:hypothetical protein